MKQKCTKCGGEIREVCGGLRCKNCGFYAGDAQVNFVCDEQEVGECDCVLCTARYAEALQVSKSETGTTLDLAQYTRFELEEFAREQVALVANYQKFVLNQRAIIASMEREIEQRDKEIVVLGERLSNAELARDMLASTTEDSLHARQYVGREVTERDKRLAERLFDLDDRIEHSEDVARPSPKNHTSTSTRCGAALAQVSQAVAETTTPYPSDTIRNS